MFKFGIKDSDRYRCVLTLGSELMPARTAAAMPAAYARRAAIACGRFSYGAEDAIVRCASLGAARMARLRALI